jgi:hypothetical protein
MPAASDALSRLIQAEGEIIMQDRNQAHPDRNPAGRDPNPAGVHKGHRGGGQKAPRVGNDAERRADKDRRPDISRAPGDRPPLDPKDTGAVGYTGAGSTPRTDQEAPGAGSDFVKRSGTWRSMKSWQPWALIGAAVLLVIIGLIVL